MTAPLPEFYAPRQPSLVEAVATNKRVTDALLRNNPLVNAAVNSGLIRWMGNYNTTGTSDKINFLWIGEFFPEDPNLGVAQRGFSLVRDDPRGGRSAIAMLDPAPVPGQPLTQVLRLTDGNGRALLTEARGGGAHYPAATPAWAPDGQAYAAWPGTNLAAESSVMTGVVSIVGRRLVGSIAGTTDSGTSGEVWLRVFGATTRDSPRLTLGPGGLNALSIDLDVSAEVGLPAVELAVMARRTGGSGFVRGVPKRLACHTPDPL